MQTLFMRSWLIFGGVALGVIARILWPVQHVEREELYPEAIEKFQELDDFGKQPSFEERLGDIKLDN